MFEALCINSVSVINYVIFQTLPTDQENPNRWKNRLVWLCNAQDGLLISYITSRTFQLVFFF